MIQVDKNTAISVCLLASGSRGNAIYVSDGRTRILIDAGLSGVEIERRMQSRGLDPNRLDGIAVSHEHTDHIQAVGVLARRFKLPIYISPETYTAASGQLGRIDAAHNFSCGVPFQIGTLELHPFSISHDASDPAGFTVTSNGTRIGIATDLGVATTMVKTHLKECTALIIEANHDRTMLEEGPYPWPLKQRIQGRSGHLSNDDTTRLLKEVLHKHLTHVILAHLSEQNNTPQKARRTVAQALQATRVNLSVAIQDRCSELFTIKGPNK
ncbi:MAG: MBL fold metallo-hydrolase [Desulfobacterales bacterium]|nr:MBL fold metallo-hydrolase [Desulfobacterales bacterium]